MIKDEGLTSCFSIAFYLPKRHVFGFVGLGLPETKIFSWLVSVCSKFDEDTDVWQNFSVIKNQPKDYVFLVHAEFWLNGHYTVVVKFVCPNGVLLENIVELGKVDVNSESAEAEVFRWGLARINDDWFGPNQVVAMDFQIPVTQLRPHLKWLSRL